MVFLFPHECLGALSLFPRRTLKTQAKRWRIPSLLSALGLSCRNSPSGSAVELYFPSDDELITLLYGSHPGGSRGTAGLPLCAVIMF